MVRVRVGDGKRYVEVETDNLLKADELIRRTLHVLDMVGAFGYGHWQVAMPRRDPHEQRTMEAL